MTDELAGRRRQSLDEFQAEHLHRPSYPRGLFSASITSMSTLDGSGRMVRSAVLCLLCGAVYEHAEVLRDDQHIDAHDP